MFQGDHHCCLLMLFLVSFIMECEKQYQDCNALMYVAVCCIALFAVFVVSSVMSSHCLMALVSAPLIKKKKKNS
ncbi:hypothetical protein AAHE18_04G021600 [Arachis hypogaea]